MWGASAVLLGSALFSSSASHMLLSSTACALPQSIFCLVMQLERRREPIGLPALLLFLVTRSLLCLVADTDALSLPFPFLIPVGFRRDLPAFPSVIWQ